MLIVDPNRGNRAAFNRRMAGAGFRLEEIDLSGAPGGADGYRGRLLRYLRDDAAGT